MLVGAVLIGAGLWHFVAAPFLVVGDSMVPTLRSWDLGLLRRCRDYQPSRGDIIMFRTADDPPLHFIKRVIALPGETLAMTSGVATINNRPLSEPYTTLNPTWNIAATNIPPGRVYVIGDNRDVPLDLAVQGLVATRLVQARLMTSWRWRR